MNHPRRLPHHWGPQHIRNIERPHGLGVRKWVIVESGRRFRPELPPQHAGRHQTKNNERERARHHRGAFFVSKRRNSTRHVLHPEAVFRLPMDQLKNAGSMFALTSFTLRACSGFVISHEAEYEARPKDRIGRTHEVAIKVTTRPSHRAAIVVDRVAPVGI